MDLLKIDEKGRGFFSKGEEWIPVESIDGDDLLALIGAVAAEKEPIGMDSCDEERQIGNPNARIVYQEIYKVLHDLDANRDLYLEECEECLRELEQKYKLVEMKEGKAEPEDENEITGNNCNDCSIGQD